MLSDEEDEEDVGTQLLPTHYSNSHHKGTANKSIRLADVWDEREELFGIGDDSDDEGAGPPPQNHAGARTDVPKITVTSS